MVDGESTFCPECGYNLRGIPEDRCPECGFGYEHAAIWSIAEMRASSRKRLYRRAPIWVAAALAWWFLPKSEEAFWGVLFVICALWAAAHRRYRIDREVLWTQFALPWRAFLVAVFLPPLLAVVGFVYPQAFQWAAAVILVAATLDLLHRPRGFPHAELSLPESTRRSVRRWSIVAWSSLAVALCAIVISLAL